MAALVSMEDTTTKPLFVEGFTAEEKEALKALAKKQDRTVSSLVRTLVREAIQQSRASQQ